MSSSSSLVSPFEGRLGTNYGPTSDERTQILQYIQILSAAVLAVDDEATHPQEVLSSLHSQRLKYETSIQEHRALLSPVRSVAPDVLTTVFEHVVFSSNTLSTRMSRRHPAVILSHISQSWRDLALNTPSLWSRIYIDIPSYPEHYTGCEDSSTYNDLLRRWKAMLLQIDETTRAWIERSANHPLILAINLRMHDRYGFTISPLAYGYIHPVMQTLLGASDRWEQVIFLHKLGKPPIPVNPVISPEGRTGILDLIVPVEESRVPILTKFSYTLDRNLKGLPAGTTAQLDRAVLRVPTLTHLCLERLDSPILPLSVQWTRLTHLRFGGYLTHDGFGNMVNLVFNPSEALRLLLSCPNLIECDFQNMAPHDQVAIRTRPTPYDTATAPLHQLQKLALQSFYTILPEIGFMTALDMPRIRRLNLRTGHLPVIRSKEISDPQDWIRHFGSQLTEVSFRMQDHGHDVIRACLEGLPNVEYLHITTADYHDALKAAPRGDSGWNSMKFAKASSNYLIQALTVTTLEEGAVIALCPKLRSLTCSFTYGTCDEGTLINFIKSRRSRKGGIERIQSVTVALPMLKERDVRGELEEMGVDLVDFALRLTYLQPIPLYYVDE